jgi:hypothetical protein
MILILEAVLVEKSLVCLATQGRSSDNRYFALRNNEPSDLPVWIGALEAACDLDGLGVDPSRQKS